MLQRKTRVDGSNGREQFSVVTPRLIAGEWYGRAKQGLSQPDVPSWLGKHDSATAPRATATRTGQDAAHFAYHVTHSSTLHRDIRFVLGTRPA